MRVFRRHACTMQYSAHLSNWVHVVKSAHAAVLPLRQRACLLLHRGLAARRRWREPPYLAKGHSVSAQDRNGIRARYLRVETPNVSDVLDDLGFANQALSADFVPRSGTQLAGWAFTISGDSVAGGPPTDPAKLQACSEVQDGDVTVWTGNGGGACFFGELIALGLQGLGCRGALIDGGVRDLAWLEQAGFPTFATYRTPVQSIGRWQVQSWGRPVALPGATRPTVEVSPGDFILGDVDGVVVIPASHVTPVLERAEAVTLRERGIRQALHEGMSLPEAIATYGAI